MKKYNSLFLKALIYFAFTVTPIEIFAQPGALDLTFGINGIVTTSIDTNSANGYSVAIQTDGKIVMVGNSGPTINRDFAIVRYNTNGTLDNSFGNNGIVTTDIGAESDEAYDVAIQSDGKILVVGHSKFGQYNDFSAVRYNTDGSLDSTFSNDGKVSTSLGTYDYAYSVVIQNDGKIILGGTSYDAFTNQFFALVRYNSDGSLDSTFDNDGKVTTLYNIYGDGANNLTIQTDGKIVVVGMSRNSLNSDLAVLRYNSNGSLDPTFDFDGIATTSFSDGNDGALSVAIQNDGKILVAGASSIGNNNFNFAMARYNTNGSLDLTFNNDGIVTTPIGNSANGYSVALQSDGKIILGGFSSSVNNSDFTLARYNTNGSLDSNFGNNGIVITPIGNFALGLSVALENNGKIILAGYSFNGSDYEFALARYNICTPITFSQTNTICAGESITVGNNIYNSSGIYTDVLTASQSQCDSIVTTNLTILEASTFSQSPSLCSGESITVGSNIYTTTGIYTDTLIAANMCDSIVITNLTVNSQINTNINVNANVITASQSGATYQWINCNNENTPIAEETNQSFAATTSGTYAVIVAQNTCSDTSSCFNLAPTGIVENSFETGVTIYPNPSTDIINILGSSISTVSVLNSFGQTIIKSKGAGAIDISKIAKGLYFIELTNDKNEIVSISKIIKD